MIKPIKQYLFGSISVLFSVASLPLYQCSVFALSLSQKKKWAAIKGSVKDEVGKYIPLTVKLDVS